MCAFLYSYATICVPCATSMFGHTCGDSCGAPSDQTMAQNELRALVAPGHKAGRSGELCHPCILTFKELPPKRVAA